MNKKFEIKIDDLVAVIRKNRLMVFISDVIAYYGITDKTLARALGGCDSEEYKTMIAALEQNRTTTKRDLRKKWFEGNNPTTDIALYRLLATPEERRAIDTYKGWNGESKKDEVIKLKID